MKVHAQMQRKEEGDLSLQGIFKEFELGRQVSQSTLGHMRTAAASFEQETLRLQERRQQLAGITDVRASKEEELQWESLDFKEHDRRCSDTLRAERMEDVRQ